MKHSEGTSTVHRWGMRILYPAILFTGAAVVLLGLEGALRLIGYGHPTSFLISESRSGNRMMVENPAFLRSFFPDGSGPGSYPVLLPEKPADTCRIFVFGGSAAHGYPDPAFSFGRILEVMLSAAYPETRFEVVNAAIPAINSHVVLPMARECARQQPDLFIVYLGNNEVIGPYGAGNSLNAFSKAQWPIRASIAYRGTRTSQLLAALALRLHLAEPLPEEKRAMDMWVDNRLAMDDPRMPALYGHYESNVRDICTAGLKAGAEVVLCTVAVNLRDFAPLASLHSERLTAAEETKWREAFDKGVALEASGGWGQALAAYNTADALDNAYADLAFRIAYCQEKLGNFAAAREAYLRARDLDALRMRADTQINAVLRRAGAALAQPHLVLADIENDLAEASPSGIPGEAFFFDQCHLTFAGNYQVARSLFPHVLSLLPPGVRASEKTAPEPLSKEDCARLLGWTPVQGSDQLESILYVSARAPFTGCSNHAAWMGRLRKETEALKPELTAENLAPYLAWYQEHCPESCTDWALHQNFARLLETVKAGEDAAKQWGLVAQQVPRYGRGQAQWARALMQVGDTAGAVAAFDAAVQLLPKDASLYRDYGRALQKSGDFTKAINAFQQFVAMNPKDGNAFWVMASAQEEMGDIKGAEITYRAGIEADPKLAGLHYYLGQLLEKQGRIEDAITEYRQGVDKAPDNAGMVKTLEAAQRKRDQESALK